MFVRADITIVFQLRRSDLALSSDVLRLTVLLTMCDGLLHSAWT